MKNVLSWTGTGGTCWSHKYVAEVNLLRSHSCSSRTQRFLASYHGDSTPLDSKTATLHVLDPERSPKGHRKVTERSPNVGWQCMVTFEDRNGTSSQPPAPERPVDCSGRSSSGSWHERVAVTRNFRCTRCMNLTCLSEVNPSWKCPRATHTLSLTKGHTTTNHLCRCCDTKWNFSRLHTPTCVLSLDFDSLSRFPGKIRFQSSRLVLVDRAASAASNVVTSQLQPGDGLRRCLVVAIQTLSRRDSIRSHFSWKLELFDPKITMVSV